MTIDWKQYSSEHFYDELISRNGRPRAAARKVARYLSKLSEKELMQRRNAAEITVQKMGISFTIYADGQNIDRAWPFDIIPRIIDLKEWIPVERGLKQRIRALNFFIDDLYHHNKIVKDGIIPETVIKQSKNFRPECIGIDPSHKVWAHICGTDLVRDRDGKFYVLEDNLRVPSGVSYMLENRAITKRVLPELFETIKILPNNDYPAELLKMLSSLAPNGCIQPQIVVLTPGIYNSAYFEHAFLAQQMGAELVEGPDLVVHDDLCVYMKTISGLKEVDVIYRRIDDLYLDPEVFYPDSTLGVPGLMRSWQAGKVAIANAPGAGVADDKVIYYYVPKMIEYYLQEEPILLNVSTYLCLDKEQRQYVLEHLSELVIKPADQSGGYGMLIGPHSSKAMREKFTQWIQKKPRNYIAQPTLQLSTAPSLVEGYQPQPRHLDLRPFVLQGKHLYCTKGGLTRVALKQGSLVVNSSQGGGSKDTWIVDTEKD